MVTEESYGGLVEVGETVTRGESLRELLSVQFVSTSVGVSTWSETTAVHVMTSLSPVDTSSDGGGFLATLTVGSGTV